MLLTFKPKFAPKQDFPEITAKSLNPIDFTRDKVLVYAIVLGCIVYFFFVGVTFFLMTEILKLTISFPLVSEGRRDQSVTNLKTCMLSLSLSD